MFRCDFPNLMRADPSGLESILLTIMFRCDIPNLLRQLERYLLTN